MKRRVFLKAVAAAGTGLAASGCTRTSSSAHATALTTWSDAELERCIPRSSPLHIIRPTQGSPIEPRLVEAAQTDLVLGASPTLCARLAAAGLLAESQVPVRPLSGSQFGLASSGELPGASNLSWIDLGAAEWSGRFSIASPASDGAMEDLILSSFETESDFAATFARWSSIFGNARRLDFSTRTAVSEMPNGKTSRAVLCFEATALPHGLSFQALRPATAERVSVALLRRGETRVEARDAFESIAAASGPNAAEEARMGDDPSPLNPGATNLMRLLVHGLLAECHPELRACTIAVHEASRADPDRARQARRFLNEAPPWPPASVGRLRAKPQGDAWLRTLASQVVADPTRRDWLLDAWARDARPIDHAIITELGAAMLPSDPRFHAWIQAEWSAWARQRYRRVARIARGSGNA